MSQPIYISVSPPEIKTISSQNSVIELKKDVGYYANIKIIVNYPTPNLTIQEYVSGNLQNQYAITQSYEIDYIATNADKIVLNDSVANYNIIVVVQYVYGDPSIIKLYRDVQFKPLSKLYRQVITSLPFTAAFTGTFQFLVEGTGVVAQAVINNNNYNINEGAALNSGAIYQFSLKLTAGTSLNLSNCTFLYGVLEEEIWAYYSLLLKVQD